MNRPDAIFSEGTLRFFRQLSRNNSKAWMDENREWYRTSVVAPFRALLDALAPIVLQLDPNFEIDGRTGTNFSRINRDIRFARDKTPYRTHMYLRLSTRGTHGGELYFGISPDSATAGFRIYGESKDKSSDIATLARPRAAARPQWLTQQKRRLGRRYDSYWYATEKRQWTKHEGWPLDPADWKNLLGWVVRKKMPVAAALRPGLTKDIAKIFREVFPLYEFTSFPGTKRS